MRSRGPVATIPSLLIAATLLVGVSSPVIGLTDEEIYGALRFPFAAPGGRMTGMGGAGLALIDDAGACRFNPARLSAISRPTAQLETRFQQFEGGSGSSGLVLYDADIHPFAGTSVDADSAYDSDLSLSYLSVAWPFPLRRPLVIAASRSQTLNTVIEIGSVTRTTPPTAPVTPGGRDEVRRISRGRLDIDLHQWDLSAGWRLTPTFSVGGTVVVGMLDLSSETTGLLADPLQFTGPGMFDPRFSGSEAEPLLSTRSEGTDTAFGYQFGTWWRPRPGLALATIFRKGARFEVEAETRDFFAGTKDSFSNVLKVPDTAGVGVVWNPFTRHPSALLQSLTIALDIDRVKYSDLLEGMRSQEGILTNRQFTRKATYDIDDATEAHLGVEVRRSFPAWTLALRGGLYTDHDERLRPAEITDDPNSALAGQARALEEGGFMIPEGDTDIHVTVGAGARFYALSFDLAVDMSDPVTQVIASATYHFGREGP